MRLPLLRLAAFALLGSTTGLNPSAARLALTQVLPCRTRSVVCLQGTSRRRATDEGDDSVSDQDCEDLFFMYDDSGAAKPWAVKPHLQTMLSELERGDAILLDVRPAAAWKTGHLDLATSCPLESLSKWMMESPPDPTVTIYIHSSFEKEQQACAAAEQLMAAGLSHVRPLAESYEALKAQLRR